MRGAGSKPRSSKKLILDDVCGKQNDSFNNKRSFQNHYRTHGEEIFQCTECPANWSGGPENMFNTKKQLVTHMFEYHSTPMLTTFNNLKIHRITKHIGIYY